ncbi:M64 family metallopeptidase [Streptomyces sp. NPDC005900]|uniref:M64 family metallopeptidase n=1 Tax=unclassified Streptomyces TaxID=2593676 RepID=UPI0033DDD895
MPILLVRRSSADVERTLMRSRIPGTSVRTSRRAGGRAGRTRLQIAVATGVAVAAGLAGSGGAIAADTTPGTPPSAASSASEGPQRQVEYFPGPDSHPRHTTIPVPAPLNSRQRSAIAQDGKVVSLVRNGPIGTKADVVFLGDGYTKSQQEDFLSDVRRKWKEVSAVEPYRTYKKQFNVWAVQAHSPESGVGGDPDYHTSKRTALGMSFYCDNVERLLCVNPEKVEAYASKAADADLVIVLANSTKYGGAGYNDIVSPSGYDGIATASSDNPDSSQIVVHETGHSLGKLADEYWYDEYDTYTGAEPWESNISKLKAAQLTAQKKKWYRWIGRTSPDGGTVGAYRGGGYYPRGIYRPTQNSIMRTLGSEFNLPGREAMIAGFHRHASVIGATTRTDREVSRTQPVTVEAGKGIQLRWYVDGHATDKGRGEKSMTPRALGVPADGRAHTVSVRGTDATDAVRDPALRKLLTKKLTWRVAG